MNRGFTLIELMVVVVLIILMTGFSVSRLVDFRDKRDVFNDAKLVVEELRRVRTKATAVEVPAGCSGVQAYAVRLADKDMITTVNCDSGGPIANYLSTSLAQASFNDIYDLSFDPHGRANGAGTIRVCKAGIGFDVVVSGEGVISQPVEAVGGCGGNLLCLTYETERAIID